MRAREQFNRRVAVFENAFAELVVLSRCDEVAR